MIKFYLALLVAALLMLRFAHWAVWPRRYVPRHRPLYVAARLLFRLHPGRGFATAFGLWLRWGRFASYRESKRTRPGLSRTCRATHPAEHSVFLGRAQYRMGLRMTIQEHLTALGPPRMFKSALLASIIMRYPGAVVSTSTKPDMFSLTSGMRERGLWPRLRRLAAVILLRSRTRYVGGSVEVFNPQGIGAGRARSTIRWNPVAGCQVESVAMRRAQALCEAVSTHGATDDAFWQEQSANMMRGFLCAADLVDADLTLVARWILSGQTQQAEAILEKHHRYTWARTIAQLRGPAERTTATIRMVLASAIGFMADPEIARCVLPGSGPEFDIPAFLRQRGTLYLIGEARGTTTPIAPLFAGLVNEIHWTATQLAADTEAERLDPPLALVLDEVTQICPIPVPSLLADSGGRGIEMVVACHGMAQLRARWGADAAQSVLDTTNLLLMPGVADPATLQQASERCGTATYSKRGGEGTEDVPVATMAMINRITRRHGLLLRSNMPPVVPRLSLAWEAWAYRTTRKVNRTAYLPPTFEFVPPGWPALAAEANGNGEGIGSDPAHDREAQLVPDLEAEGDGL